MSNKSKKEKGLFWRTKELVTMVGQPGKESAKDLKESVANNTNALKKRLQDYAKNRDSDSAKGFETDFNTVLKAWGMTENDIPQVLKELKIRMSIFLVPVILAFYLATKGSRIIAITLMISAILGFVTTLWRYNILEKRQFKSFPMLGWLQTKKTKDTDSTSNHDH